MLELETASRAAPTWRSSIRLTVIRALVLGQKHIDLAAIFNVSLRSIQRWVTQFNTQGIDGLLDKPRSGRPPKISPEQSEHLRDLIENPEKAGQTHWTAKKFHGYIRDDLEKEIGYSTVVRWLHNNDFRLKVPQPWPDRQDEEKRKAFITQLGVLLSNPEVEIWFGDEMGVEGDPRPRRRWAKKGDKTRITKNGDHIRMNVMGMVCPRTGEFYALEFTHSDRDCFQAFLDHANRDIDLQRPRNILILDNASWHKAKSLDWGKLEPLYLPPYSPDLNPIERLWLLIKAEWFTDFIAKDREQLIDRLTEALLWAMNRKNKNQNSCSIKTKL